MFINDAGAHVRLRSRAACWRERLRTGIVSVHTSACCACATWGRGVWPIKITYSCDMFPALSFCESCIVGTSQMNQESSQIELQQQQQHSVQDIYRKHTSGKMNQLDKENEKGGYGKNRDSSGKSN